MSPDAIESHYRVAVLPEQPTTLSAVEFDPALVPGMRPDGMRHSLYNTLVTPRPIGWISTISARGVVNLAPFSFFNSVSGEPPCVMYCVNGTHSEGGPKDSLANVREVGEFVFNLCSFELKEQMNLSSASLPRSVNEMAEAGLTAATCVKVRPPRVEASPIALECEVHDIITLPSTETVINTMVIGRVVYIHIADRVIVDGMVDSNLVRPLARLGYQDYAALKDAFALTRPS